MIKAISGIITFILCSIIASASIGQGIPPNAKDLTLANDPYRWMEKTPNPRFDAWLAAHGKATRAKLDALPTFSAWQERVRSAAANVAFDFDKTNAGGRIFFLRSEGKGHTKLMCREKSGEIRVLYEPSSTGEGGKVQNITQFVASPDGALLAVTVSEEGTGFATGKFLKVSDGSFLPDTLDRVLDEQYPSWSRDSAQYAYTRTSPMGDASTDPVQNMQVRIHRIGTASQDDLVVLGPDSHSGISGGAPEDIPTIDLESSEKWAVAVFGGARPEDRICVALQSEVLADTPHWSCPVAFEDGVRSYAVRGSELYLVSLKNAPTGQILKLDMESAREISAATSVVMPTTSVISDIYPAKDAIYFEQLTNGVGTLQRLPDGRGPAVSVPTLNGVSVFGVSTSVTESGAMFSTSNWTTPPENLVFFPENNETLKMDLGNKTGGSYENLTVLETEATSRDGTKVPLTVIFPKDLRRDGSSKAIILAYGSFGGTYKPSFDSSLLEWARADNVVAVAHVRGGGEKGEDWHLAGKGANKHNGVDDLIACARTLTQLGFTSPHKTSLMVASAGGLVGGGAMVEAPSSFGAVVIHAGELNPARIGAQINGANMYAEYGDPRTPDGLASLKAMDPYLHIRNGTNYPATLLIVGKNDSRVSTWVTGKFGARLASATRSKKPVWILVNGDQGHNGSFEDNAIEQATVFAFLDATLN